MNAQVKELSPVEAFITDCLAYSSNAVRIAALKEEQAGLVSANSELRKTIVPFFKEHKDDKWSKLGKDIKAAIVAAGVKDVDGLLGVLKTSFEYKILPTEQNADRLRKRETWVSWSGTVVPNTYGKVHVPKTEATAAAAAPTPTPTPTPTPATKLEAFQKAVDSLIPPETTQDKPIAAPAKPTTPQKAVPKGEITRPNISSTDEPLSAREHCTILLDQLFKNDAFKAEFAPILATMLDSNVGIVTRCLVEARNLFCNGGK
jgi:hypothetical protein